MPKIQKVLIANRGEIALRIIKTCQANCIQTVVVFSEADRFAPFVKAADEAIFIGESPASASYLNQAKIIQATLQSGADAIHPGYGFLSENAEFAQKVAQNNLIFIGPSAEAIAKMGSKIKAKQIMQENGVPIVPGYNGDNQELNYLIEEAQKIGFPVLIKASAGGGGKGMRVVRQLEELESAIEGAKREALNSFGDDKILLEKYFDSVRHIEFQIFGDQQGNVIHLFERECSIQRRHQKVIEEAPSAFLGEDLRKKMGESAIKAGQAIGYTNAGTVEFIVDEQGNYYFLEVNTRLQVEHPVTEMITGLDLVKLQIDIAEGKSLLDNFRLNGHAIEARLYAEDPENNFLPDTGEILAWQTLPNIRIDSGVEVGYEVSTFYDPMLAKIITYGENRAEAIRKMQYSLQNLTVLGLKTNQYFLAKLMQNADFQAGNFNTHFLDQQTDLTENTQFNDNELTILLSALLLKNWQNRQAKRRILSNLISGWRNNFYEAQFETYQLINQSDKPTFKIQYRDLDKGKFSLTIPNINPENADIQLLSSNNQSLTFLLNEQRFQINLAQKNQDFYLKIGTKNPHFRLLPRLPEPVKALGKGAYEAPMPGEVVKILVEPTQSVEAGQALLIINSMKMENTVYAHSGGQIKEIFVNEKTLVKAGDRLLRMEEFS